MHFIRRLRSAKHFKNFSQPTAAPPVGSHILDPVYVAQSALIAGIARGRSRGGAALADKRRRAEAFFKEANGASVTCFGEFDDELCNPFG